MVSVARGGFSRAGVDGRWPHGLRRAPWAGEETALQANLEAGRLDRKPGEVLLPTRYDARELEGLPEPVQRYFRAALTDGPPIITASHDRHRRHLQHVAPRRAVEAVHAVDDHSANATMADGPLSLTLLFRSNHAGLIGSFHAEARGGMVGNKMVIAPWEGAWSNY